MKRLFFLTFTLIVLLLPSKVWTQNIIYSNNINSASVSDWTLSGVSCNGQLIFAKEGSYAIMPALPAGATNMQVAVKMAWADYIRLYTSPDGKTYTDQGFFAHSTNVETMSKSMPDGTRYVKFEAKRGEPTLHPDILSMIELARSKNIDYVMLNTNGLRIAEDSNFVEQLSRYKGGFEVYLQF